jgi:hypothetical protein
MEHECQVRHRGVSHALGYDLFQEPVANAGEFVVIHADERCDV